MKEQIFISYRRDGGDVTAKLICEALKNRGYTVFYDFDSLSGGYFDERIFRAIDGCDTFILVLPENSMDRCVNDDDWVRQEIVRAKKGGKTIIPVMLPGFKFPDNLPEDIADIPRINGVTFVMNYFDSVIDTIVDRITAIPMTIGSTTKGIAKNSLIRNVCSFGSCDFDSTSPADAYYSEVIDRSKYNVIYFSVSTAPIKDKQEIHTKFIILDSKGNVAYEYCSEFDWEENYNRVILSWVIKGTDGSFVKAGNYRAVFQIENSSEYEYDFKVTNGTDTELTESEPSAPSTPNKGNWRNMALACPKIFVQYMLTFIAAIFFFTLCGSNATAWAIIFAIATLILEIYLFKSTHKKITQNVILSFLVVTVGFLYYGIFLAIMTIANIFGASKWKKQLNNNNQ